ncbi:MAG TPA: aldo/keto reductase [Rhodothermales bacterium]|nr:aldo/keto reductase [Rhodothermales bacterium]
MEKRKLGYTDLNLTTIGLGTWAQGGNGWAFAWGAQDDRDSIAAIHRALDLGVNWIDTAAVYGFGHAEEVLGRALKGHRQDAIVATKCSRVWDEGNPFPYASLKAESIRRECENSLRRLGIDVIDLYQVHWPQPEQDLEEAWSTIADLIREGKLRYAGVSNFNVGQIERVQAIHPVASLQPPYSMLRRGAEDELLAYCASHDIGVVAYSPMQTGLLTGKFTRERVRNLPEDDFRRDNTYYQEPELSANLDLVEKLRPVAERNGHTLAQLAIAWVLRRPEVTSAIVGARRPSQIEETAPAADWTLSDEDAAEIEGLLQEREVQLAEAAS